MVSYKKVVSTGFSIPSSEINNNALIEKLIADFNSPANDQLVGIQAGLFAKEEIETYYKEHSSKSV